MSDTRWTPGPWRVEMGYSDWGLPRSHAVVPDDGSKFDFDSMIAEVHSLQPYCAGESRVNIEKACTDIANARLIAAAPDLYEALDSILLSFSHEHLDHISGGDCGSKARAALAKARGKS